MPNKSTRQQTTPRDVRAVTRKRQSDGDTPAELAARGKRWHRAASRAWVKDHPGHTVTDFDHWGSCAATAAQARHWEAWETAWGAGYRKRVASREASKVVR